MNVTPCEANSALRKMIDEYAEVLKVQAHTLGAHGLDEKEFYASGLFRGVIERIRGQFSASMGEKRAFVQRVLNHMQDAGRITDWQSAGGANRHDYSVTMPNGRIVAIELKGCLDGNNTNIFDRPPHAHEFILWSVCTNQGADPRHNAWSGIHTRLSAEIISRNQRVDGLIIWDWVCGTIARPCPKILTDSEALTEIGPYRLPPPCIYLFPATIPSPRNNPNPQPQQLQDVHFFDALHQEFKGTEQQINKVAFAVEYQGSDTMRTTAVSRDGAIVQVSGATPIRRS